MMISDEGKHLILLIVRLMSNEYRILISLKYWPKQNIWKK